MQVLQYALDEWEDGMESLSTLLLRQATIPRVDKLTLGTSAT